MGVRAQRRRDFGDSIAWGALVLKKAEKARFIMDTLDELYPRTPVPLSHRDTYSLLVAVLLSAQCTDKRVNQVTPALFAEAATPEAMIRLTPERIREHIRPCGLSERKAQNIWDLSHILLQQHDGQVPESFEALEALPGVGHKTASVVMAQGFGHPAFPVDTHIHRLANRWGLTRSKSVVKTERDLKKAFPREYWNKLHLQIIFYGREYCPARGHQPEACPICHYLGTARTAPAAPETNPPSPGTVRTG